jgi:hypothetical protein
MHGSMAGCTRGSRSGSPSDEPFVAYDDSGFISRAEAEDLEPPAEQCAREFLRWIAERYPRSVDDWVSKKSIEKVYPEFQAEFRCSRSIGSVLREVGWLTEKRAKEFHRRDGRRYTPTQYFIPKKPEAEVFQLPERKSA